MGAGILWRWIPTLYFTQALPNVAVTTLAVVMYKNLGLGNAEIALYTSWLYLPWVIKPLWSPLVELVGSKRGWTVGLQGLTGVAFALVAFTLPASEFLRLTLAMFWLLAFASATHDVAADGLYMLALSEPQQAAFVGVRSTFFRLGMIAGQGALVVLAGRLFERGAGYVLAWQAVFALLALLLGAAAPRRCGMASCCRGRRTTGRPCAVVPACSRRAGRSCASSSVCLRPSSPDATSPSSWRSCCCIGWAKRSC